MKKVQFLFFVFAFANALQANHLNQSFFEENFSLLDTCAAFNWPVVPTDSCHNAPPFCADYLNGYCSINDGYSAYAPGNLSAAFGCPIENNQWLTFMPCESTVAFVFSVDDCVNGNGLQFGVFQTNNCFGFNALTPCFEVADGTTDTLMVDNLVPGETYYLMVDGQLADICHWEITNLQGAAGEAYLQEDITQGYIEGECDICLGIDGPPSDAFMYSAVAPICNLIQIDTTCEGDPVPCIAAPQQFCEPHQDTLYDPIKWDTIWQIIPMTAGHFVNDDSIGMTVEVVWDSVGTFYLEAVIKAVEFDTIPFFNNCIDRCKTICPDPEGDNCIIERKEINISIPDEFNFFFVKCPEECIPIQINNNGGSSFIIPFLEDTISGGAGTIFFCSEGFFEFYVIDDGGCVDHYIINIDEFIPEDLYVTLEEECPGECVVYNGQTYCPGSYQIPYIDFNGCQATIFLEVIAASGGNVFISGESEINCFNPTASLSASSDYNGSVDYFWSNGLSGQNIIVTSGGEYIVSVFAGNCLIGEAVFIVTEYFNEQFNLGIINLCIGDCFPLNGINYCDEGNYVEEFTDPNTGCTETYIFTIVIDVQPDFQIGPISEVCDGINEMYTVGFTILNGEPPFSVNGNLINGNFYQSNPIPSGDSYYFNVQSINNCGINEEIVSGFFECPCLTESGTMGLAILNQCEDEMVTPDFNNDEFLDPNDLLIFILHDNSGNSLGNIIGMNATGVFGFVPGMMQYGETYYISPIAGNELNGNLDLNSACLSVGAGQPVVFYEIPTLSPMPTQQLNCINTSEQLEIAVEGGSGIFIFQWVGPNGFASNNASPIIGQGGTYTCTVIDEVSGCSVVESVFVEEDFATPQFDINSSGLITCTDTIATLQIIGSPLNNYEWTLPDGTNSVGPLLETALPGTYSVSATSLNGCVAEEILIVNEVDGPEILMEMDWQPPTCFEEEDGFIVISDVIGAASPFTTMINGNSIASDNLFDLPAGDYQISIVDNNGCTGDTLITLPNPPEVIVELGNNVFAQLNEQVELSFQSSIFPASVLWSGPDGQFWEGVNNLVLLATENGVYEVNIMDENGCSGVDSIELFVSGQGEVFIPNAFSPNGDNQNDFLTVYAGNDVEEVKSFLIFDRWGNKVFDKENFLPNKPSMGWDGTYKNKKMDPQVFAYKAEVKFETGEIKIITGDALLIN
ncbi:MAG: gliding motility-associated C-terminal domain-containing protein [Saprospiraceae bacterium]